MQEIRKKSSPKLHGNTAGDKDPADLPSLGITAKELVENSYWCGGPKFLRNPENHWPNTSQGQNDDDQAMTELGKCSPDVTHSFVNCQEHTPVVDFFAVIDAKKYSSLTRLRFIGNLREKISGNTN